MRGMPFTDVMVMAKKAKPIRKRVRPIDLISSMSTFRYLFPLKILSGITIEKQRNIQNQLLC